MGTLSEAGLCVSVCLSHSSQLRLLKNTNGKLHAGSRTNRSAWPKRPQSRKTSSSILSNSKTKNDRAWLLLNSACCLRWSSVKPNHRKGPKRPSAGHIVSGRYRLFSTNCKTFVKRRNRFNIQVSAVADKPARRAASRPTCCKPITFMLSVINLPLS